MDPCVVKIVHFADAHCGSDMSGPIDKSTGLPVRLMDYLGVLDFVAEFIEEEGDIDLVLFCGDAFKGRSPSVTLIREFANRINRMAESTQVVLVPGNHDTPGSYGTANALDVFRIFKAANVLVADVSTFQPHAGVKGNIQLAAVPWFTRHQMMTDKKMRGLSMDKIRPLLVDEVVGTISELSDLVDGDDGPAVLASHLSVEGAVFGSEREFMLGDDMVIPLSVVVNTCFDYVALGHVHRHQILHDDGPMIVYSGSTERVTFNEESDVKGFSVVTIEKSVSGLTNVSHMFVPLPARELLTIEAHPSGPRGTQEVLNEIAVYDLSEKVVRLVVETDAETSAMLDDAKIAKALDGAFQVSSIVKNVDRPQRLRLGDVNYEQLSVEDLLRAYLMSKGIDDDRQEVLVDAAKSMMEEISQ